MSEPNTITTRRTHVNGKEIVALEPALGPHPRWPDRMVPREGVTRALLEDGTEVYLCDGDGKTVCTFTAEKPMSVSSHRNGSHNRTTPFHSLYSDEVIRRIATEVGKAKRAGVRGYAEAAAAALNRDEVPTVMGKPWTPEAVSRIYTRWAKGMRIRLPREAKPAAAPKRAGRGRAVAGPVLNGSVTVLEQDDLQVVRTFVTIVPALAQALTRIADFIEAGQDIDSGLAEKARRYDELQALLNGRG
jgi:hypothetical protein